MREKAELLRKLFFSTLYLSAFTFGGGYVIVTLLKEKFVDEYHWIDEKEMLDLVAIAQSCPGAIAVNGAIVVGYKLAGLAGVAVCVLGTILPPFLIISVLFFFYRMFQTNPYVKAVLDGMQAGVGAVIASVVFDMGKPYFKEKDIPAIIVMLLAFCADFFWKVNVVYIILICAAIGAGRVGLRALKKGGTQ